MISHRKIPKTLRKAGLAALAPISAPSSSSHKEQPLASSSVLQRLHHAIPKMKRRASDAPPPGDYKPKRPRSGPSNVDLDDDIIVIDDPAGPAGGGQENRLPKNKPQQQKKELSHEEQLNSLDTVNFFRLDPKKLGYVQLRLPGHLGLTCFVLCLGARRSIKYYTSPWMNLSALRTNWQERRSTAQRYVRLSF